MGAVECKLGAIHLLVRAVELMEQSGVCECATISTICSQCLEMEELMTMTQRLQELSQRKGD